MKRFIIKILFVTVINIGFYDICAQGRESVSQYLYSQLFLNPAYAGVDNALSIDLFAQRQWMGIKGAPQKYQLVAHSPLNNSQMSIGGSFNLFKTGVTTIYKGNFAYAYLIKLSNSTLLSLGIDGSVRGGQNGFNELNLTHSNDPYFAENQQYKIQFNSGFGSFLYSSNYYVGVSVPHILKLKNEMGFNVWDVLERGRSIITSAGYSLPVSDQLTIKPKAYLSFYEAGEVIWNAGAQFNYNDILSIGLAHHSEGVTSTSLGVYINSNLQVRYAFEFTNNDKMVSKNNHEVSIGYTIKSLYISNPDRIIEQRIRSSMKSLRNF